MLYYRTESQKQFNLIVQSAFACKLLVHWQWILNSLGIMEKVANSFEDAVSFVGRLNECPVTVEWKNLNKNYFPLQEMEDFIFIFSLPLALLYWASLWRDLTWHSFYLQQSVTLKWQLPNRDWLTQSVSLELCLHHTFGDSWPTHGVDSRSYNFHCCRDSYFRLSQAFRYRVWCYYWHDWSWECGK